MSTKNDYVLIGQDGKSHLTIIRGVPGMGKTTYAKLLMKEGNADNHIESDMWFERTGQYLFDREKLHAAHNWCLATVQVLLNQGKKVIVSNTFTTYKELKDYVNYCKINGHGLTLVSMTKEYGSIHKVPEETMQAMRERYESHDEIREKIRA